MDNEALRTAVNGAIERGEVTLPDLARALGYTRPDTVRIKRDLGLVPARNGQRRLFIKKTLAVDKVQRIADAAGLDPMDVGL